ncbi:hypothetical protein EB796_009464 [Bugula neritina]|uniref:Uncharacterized protein n=1 Tax=Bugula neritina TaxID=10212 RepID=A0A7J7K260_BUGNE|nr:hypothetical protein EB796_009464 [Bugula neritina]
MRGARLVRLIDSGRLLGKPLSDLHLLPSSEELDCEALSSVASVSGIVPAGGSKTWGMTAKELMKELLEGCESCQVVPKGQAAEVLPCDVLLPKNFPVKYKECKEIIHISLKDKLLDSGVALRKCKVLLENTPAKSAKISANNVLLDSITKEAAKNQMDGAVDSHPDFEGSSQEMFREDDPVEDFDGGMDNSFLCEVTKPKFPSFASTRRVTNNKMKISRSSWVTKVLVVQFAPSPPTRHGSELRTQVMRRAPCLKQQLLSCLTHQSLPSVQSQLEVRALRVVMCQLQSFWLNWRELKTNN